MLRLFLFLAVLLIAACRQPQASRDDANTPAGKVGQAAHRVANDAGKAVKAAGKEIGKAAREARAGWNEAAERDRAKRRE